jgi:hypothetical protein
MAWFGAHHIWRDLRNFVKGYRLRAGTLPRPQPR